MAKERPANHIHPVFTLAVLLIGIPLFLWWKMSVPPDPVNTPAPPSIAAQEPWRFAGEKPETKPEGTSDEQWAAMQGMVYDKRLQLTGLTLDMTFSDLKEYDVWRRPLSVGSVEEEKAQVLTYRTGSSGELVQLIFVDGALKKIECDPGCIPPDATRRRLGM